MYSTAFLDVPALSSAQGTVTLPGSKSISNRVLLLAALCQGTTTLHDLLDSDDTRVMLAALRQMGCKVEVDGSTVRITGLNGQAPAQTQRENPPQPIPGHASPSHYHSDPHDHRAHTVHPRIPHRLLPADT